MCGTGHSAGTVGGRSLAAEFTSLFDRFNSLFDRFNSPFGRLGNVSAADLKNNKLATLIGVEKHTRTRFCLYFPVD